MAALAFKATLDPETREQHAADALRLLSTPDSGAVHVLDFESKVR
jgi:hypothetical protein